MIAIGALLLGGVLAARVAERLRLPRLTGHMLCGIVLGATLLGSLQPETTARLHDVERLVACVIAFCVGSLLSFRDVRACARTISWVVPCAIVMVVGSSALTLVLASPIGAQHGMLVAALSVTLAAVSPTVVVTVAGEVGARGPLTRTVLTGVVVADVVLMACLIALSAGATLTSGGGGAALEVLRSLAAALAAGIAIGLVLARLGEIPMALVLGIVLLAAHALARVLGGSALVPLAVAVAAGIVGGTSSETADARRRTISTILLPVAAALLFGLEGMLLDLPLLVSLAVPVLALVAVRSLGIYLGARLGSGAAHAEPQVRRWAFAGFLPQAGFALAMVSLLPALFPELDEGARALAVGVIGINELVMPAVLRHAFTRAGETGASLAPAVASGR